LANHPLEAITEPIPVRNFTRDNTPPRVEEFQQIDLNTYTITVKFSEPVQLPVNLSYFTLQSTSAGGENITLLPGGSSYVTADHTLVQFQLDPTDIRTIKLGSGPGTGVVNTYLSVLENAALDLSGLSSVEVGSSNALQVVRFEEDNVAPSLLSFTLDLNRGELNLTFDDIVNVNTLNAARITLLSNLTNTADDSTYTLTGGTSSGESDYLITVQLLATDLNAIKARSRLAVNGTTTYIQITPETIDDLAGIPVMPIEGNDAIMTDVVIPDTTPPEVIDFSIDLNAGELILLFSEVISVPTLNITQITLQSQSTINGTNATTFTLTGAI